MPPSDHRFRGLSGRDVAVRLIRDHFDPTSDLTAVLDLQAAAPRCSEHLSRTTNDKAAASSQRAIDRSGDLCILDFNLSLKDTSRRN